MIHSVTSSINDQPVSDCGDIVYRFRALDPVRESLAQGDSVPRRGAARELGREPTTLFPRCALIRGMLEASTADWWGATVTWHLTPFSV